MSNSSTRGATPVGTLSASLEDYLEIILQLQQEKRVARVRDIALRKGVSNASVSNALARLDRDGFVRHEAHEFVELTPRGEELARRVLLRHEFLVSFLRDVLQVSAETAETDACAIEHQVSSETLERLASFYQFVNSCPMAGPGFLEAFASCCSSGARSAGCQACDKPCPMRDGDHASPPDPHVVPLASLQPGESGTLVRLGVASPLRERLVDAGFLPNVRLEITRATPDGRAMRVSAQGAQFDLDRADAAAVFVRK